MQERKIYALIKFPKLNLHTMVKSSGTDMAQIASMLKDGSLKSKLYRSFTFDQMGEAHLLLESGKTTGKIVLSVNGN